MQQLNNSNTDISTIIEKGRYLRISSHQEDAVEQLKQWYRGDDKSYVVLAGYAGTGKTYIVPRIISELGVCKPLVATYTAKAALVLQKKDIRIAQTIHSMIYDCKKTEDKQGRKHFSFTKKTYLDADIIIIDEASMVPENIFKDLMTFNIPILFIGDHYQLPPIKDSFNIMLKKDIIMTEVHRQALDNPIIGLSMKIRNKENIGYFQNDICCKIPLRKLKDSSLLNASQVITGKNKTRVMLNGKIRELMGNKTKYPVKDEKLIVLKNDRSLGVFNGQQITLLSDLRKKSANVRNIQFLDSGMDISELLNAEKKEGELWLKGFNQLSIDTDLMDLCPKSSIIADFGYAISVHKSQGSEWDNVIFYDDHFGTWDEELRSRYCYTAVTRAKKKLIWVC